MTGLPHIGRLRTRVVIEAPVRASDGAGGAIETWQTFADAFAAVRPLSGTEVYADHRFAGRVTHEAHLRVRTGVTPAMRLRIGTRLLAIRAVLPADDRGRRITCLCEERDL